MKKSHLYQKDIEKPFKISRTKIQDYLSCPRCFYLDRRLGIGKPSMPGFALNTAVDVLLKKEFDLHRAKDQIHPLMQAYNIDAVPYQNEKIDEWRENFVGIQCHHKPTNFLVFGAVDDIWKDRDNKLIVVDYKATSTSKEISLEDEYKQGFKKQIEIYQWLLRQNGFEVSDMGYFVYANGRKDREAFDAKLEFDIQILDHKGDDSWVEPTLLKIKKCLDSNDIPDYTDDCEYCKYNQKQIDLKNPQK